MAVKNPTDIKEFLQAAFITAGLDASKASEIVDPVAAKCDEYYSWRPYGGATSFDDVDAQKAISEYTYQVDMSTGALRAIIDNILESSDLADNASKVAAMTKAVSDYEARITKIQLEPSQKTKGIYAKIKELIGFNIDPDEVVVEEKEKPDISQMPVRAFKTFVDVDGNQRWIAYSSNAFEDLEKELFTTSALEEAVSYADKANDHGPLLLYHVPSAVVGQCDFQGVQGRVLVESGTFDDSELGRKALEYFNGSKEDFQVSIGFTYLAGDELDGQYDWLRINERSVCPFGTAANPWTAFNLIGDNPMEATKIAFMETVFGKELAVGVIAKADEATKALEMTTRFKEMKKPADDDEEDEKKPAKKEGEAAVETPAAEAEVAPGTVVVVPAVVAVETTATPAETKDATFGPEQLAALAQHIALLTTAVESLPEMQKAIVALADKVKEIGKDQDERMGETMSPRWTLPGLNRPSTSDKTALTPEEQEKLTALKTGEEVEDQTAADPARAYVNDLFGIKA